MIIGIWVIIGFLLLPSGSFRYWTVAFIALLLIVAAGDRLPARALLVALLALHVLFVVPAAARSGQRRHLAMAFVSAALLTWLVIAGGVRYWLPALMVAVLEVPFGVPLLWSRPRSRPPAFEVRMWPRRRAPGDSRPPFSARRPGDATLAPKVPPDDSASPVGEGESRAGGEESGAGDGQPPSAGHGQGSGAPGPPRNTRSFPSGQRPGGRPMPQPRTPRRRKPPPSA